MATINTTDPKPGYVYDTDTDTWYPLLGLAVQALDELTDVVLTTPATNQVLMYNGTNWVNSGETGDITAVTSGTGITVTSGTGPIPTVAVDTAVTATTNNTLTLSNKTIALGSNTVSGTVAQFNTALTDGDFATLAGTETLTGKTLTSAILTSPVFTAPEETVNVTGTAFATGTNNIDTNTAGVWFFNSNATANGTLNFRASSGASLSSILNVGQSITIGVLIQNGSTAYYPTTFQIDGSSVTPKWQGGSAPSAGNASSTDIYAFNIIKTAATPTYSVFASQTKFA